MMSRFLLCLAGFAAVVHLAAAAQPPAAVQEISSLNELASLAAKDGQRVKMKAGLYRLRDFISLESVPERRKRKVWQFIHFTGSDNVFDLTGVTVELDTALREKLHAPIHTDEFLISGSRVTLKGLTITSVGQGKAYGGAVLGLAGEGTRLEQCTIHVEGSSPYGYGDLFGKGGHKHSGVHITGSHTKIIGCRIYNRSFGHGFYMQENCDDIFFENCYVEGVMRPTDAMLAETAGMAFDRQFEGEVQNRSGGKRIQPGYMKALSEDAFRTYTTHRQLVLKNCTAKNMRGGFELRTKTAPKLENCTAVGCERGFWVSDGATLTGCKGDARYGPLLYVEGDRAQVAVELLPEQAKGITVHATAVIYGKDNRVTLTVKKPVKKAAPIWLGYTPPPMGENASVFGERVARGLVLRNETAAPVKVGAKAENCQIASVGSIQEDLGKNTVIQPLVTPGKAAP